MGHGFARASHIIHANKWQREARCDSVDQDDRDAHGEKGLQEGVRASCRREDQSFDPLGQQQPEIGLRLFLVLVAIAHDEVEAVRLRDIFDTADKSSKEWVSYIGKHYAERTGALRPQASRHRTGVIA